MPTPRLHVLILLAAVIFAGGCDTTATQPDTQVVVEAYLRARVPVPSVRLTRSVEVDERYVPSDAAVRGADVAIQQLGGDGEVLRSVELEEERPGVYGPANSPLVQPRTTYRLVVTTPGGTEITATTTVPDTLSVLSAENQRAVYQGPAQPTLTITAPQSNREQQSVLLLTTTSLLNFETTPEEELRDQLTPPYASGYDPETDTLAAYRVTSSGVLNEENFDRTPSGNIETRVPWLSVAFFGRNEVGVHVIDDNLYDFIRTQQVQQGGPSGGGLAPGEIPNVIDPVEGGTGIFGSFARTSQRIEVKRPDGG